MDAARVGEEGGGGLVAHVEACLARGTRKEAAAQLQWSR
jgi:hypothetical protein